MSAGRVFKGRVVLPGPLTCSVLVSRQPVNALATYIGAGRGGPGKAVCADQNNADLYGKRIDDRILCLPRTIGSTATGIVFMLNAHYDLLPRGLLFAEPIDSLAAAAVLLADIWMGRRVVAVDGLGAEFLAYAQDDMLATIREDGTVALQGAGGG